MLITYRRTGSALGLTAGVLTMTVLTVAVAVIAVIGAVVIAPVAILARALKPTSRRTRRAASTSPWPGETIEADVVTDTVPSDDRDPLRLNSKR